MSEDALILDTSPPPSVVRQRNTDSPEHEYPETFVCAVRETPVPPPELTKINSKEFAVTGQGLEAIHRMKVLSLTDQDLYTGDIDFLPIDGQVALKEIEKTKIRRARERTMQELKNILERVRLTLKEFKHGDKEDEEQRKEERRRKRQKQRQRKRKRTKKAHQKKKEELRAKIMKEQRLKEENEDTSRETTTENKTQPGESGRHSPLRLVRVVESVMKVGVQEGPESEGEETPEIESSGNESDESEEEDTADEGDESSSELEFESEDEEDEEEETQEEDEPGEEVIVDGVIVKPKKVSRAALKKAARRRQILKTIASYLELCIQREDLMRQMKQWIETSVSEEFSAIKPVLCFSPELLGDHKPTNIATDMEKFNGFMGKLKDIADSLGIGEGKELEDIDETAALLGGARPPTQGRTQKPTTSTFTEEELAHPDSWKLASTLISKALDDASKTTPARRVRQSLTTAGKQFKFMSLAMDKRVEKIRQLDKEILDSGGEMAKLKKNNEILRDTKKKLQVKYEKIEYKNTDLLQKLRDTEEQVKELTEVVEDYKKKESLGLYDQSSSEESLASSASNKTVSLVSLVPSGNMLAPTGEKQQITTRIEGTQTPQLVADLDPATKQDMSKLMKEYEKVKNQFQTEKEKRSELEVTVNVLSAEKVKFEQEKTELEIKLDDLSRQTERDAEQKQKQMEELEMANVKMKNELECQEEMIKYQEDRITQYSEELQILEERLQSFPPTPAAQSRASIAQFAHAFRQERRRSSLAVEPATAKQMLAKVKQQHEQEIQSLKDHLGRENQRNQADLRRLEQEHKKDTQNIHKESLQVLRAINRFKDSIANILDRENLLTEAHEMRKLNQLPLEETLVDTRQMLARMAILSNELLVSMELCLSKAMMSKRLEIKDTTAIKGLVQRDLDRHMEALKKAKDFGLLQMEKFKGVREDLHEQELEHMRARQTDEMKQFDLVDQFKEVVNQYGDLKKQSASSRKQHQEEIKRKNDQVKRVMRRSEELNKTIDQQKTIINQLTSQFRSRRIGQVYISREDQQMNLKILQEALAENQISEQLCQMTSGMIKESLEYPRKRFIALVKKYYHYKRAKEIRENVKKLKLEGSLSQRITEYLKVLGQRSEMQREAWLRKKQEFIQMRANIIEQLNIVITRVNEETGILLTRPFDLSTRTEDGHEVPSGKPPHVTKGRSRYRRMAESEQRRAPPGARAPSPLSGTNTGTNMVVEYEQRMLWKIPHGYSSTMVTTPRILEMEVNRSRMAAQSMMRDIAMGQWDRLDSRYRRQQVIGRSRSEPAYKQAYNAGIKRNLSLPPIAALYPEEKKPQKPKPN